VTVYALGWVLVTLMVAGVRFESGSATWRRPPDEPERGIDATSMDAVAERSGVSKATIYNRFGGRQGLIDAVIGELVAAEMYRVIDRAVRVEDPWERIATYLTDRRDLLYREPAFTDALLMTYPDSKQLVALAKQLPADRVSAGISRAWFFWWWRLARSCTR